VLALAILDCPKQEKKRVYRRGGALAGGGKLTKLGSSSGLLRRTNRPRGAGCKTLTAALNMGGSVSAKPAQSGQSLLLLWLLAVIAICTDSDRDKGRDAVALNATFVGRLHSATRSDKGARQCAATPKNRCSIVQANTAWLKQRNVRLANTSYTLKSLNL
jgi:hypothetical protein